MKTTLTSTIFTYSVASLIFRTKSTSTINQMKKKLKSRSNLKTPMSTNR